MFKNHFRLSLKKKLIHEKKEQSILLVFHHNWTNEIAPFFKWTPQSYDKTNTNLPHYNCKKIK